MAHEHDDHSHHHHVPRDFGPAFALGISLNGAFVVIEALFGIFSHSLALLADAGHNLSDVLGLLLAWGASVMVKKAASARRTYGYRRSSILAALANAGLLFAAVGGIVAEAVQRFQAPAQIAGQTLIWVSAAGIVVNGATALLFMRGSEGDLNVRGAFLHMVADALVSAGVLVAGVVILYSHWWWLDPAMSILIALVILWGTWSLLVDSLNLAMDAVPRSIEVPAVRAHLAAQPAVHDVHHLHIWALSTTEIALTAHLAMNDDHLNDALLHRLSHELEERFGIHHATIQFETLAAAQRCPMRAHAHGHEDEEIAPRPCHLPEAP